jgi:protein O-mannosyl-transferase
MKPKPAGTLDGKHGGRSGRFPLTPVIQPWSVPHRFAVFLPPLLMLLATFAVYGQILGHDFIANWDDSYYVTQNPDAWGFSWANLRAVFTRCYAGNYAPVQMLSYMLDYELWGLKPGGYYLSNIVIHTLNGLLLYALLSRWYGNRSYAFIAAAIFLFHPVQVESVAWISQRKTLLAMFFFLAALLWYGRYRSAVAGSGRSVYGASLAAFVLSLMAKSVAVILPVALILYDLCFSDGDRRLRLKDKVPFIVAAGICSVGAVYSQQPEDNAWMGRGGGITSFHGGSPLATFFTMLTVFCRYLRMLVWPTGLSPLYTPPIHRSLDPQVGAAALLLIALAWAGVWLYRVDRRLGFWLLIFWLGLLPVSQFVPLATLMNDRYLYFPMIGAAALAAAGALFVLERLGTRRRLLRQAIVAVLLLPLMFLSCQRAAFWRNPTVLWRDVVAGNPNFAYGWLKLSEAYLAASPPRKHDALQALRRSLELDPSFMTTWYKIGVLYNDLGDYDQGHEALQTFLVYNPEHVMGIAALGYNFQMRGKFAEAKQAYQRALALQPDSVELFSMLGSLALAQGELAQARTLYRRVESQWHDPESAFQLACVESLAGEKGESLAWLEKALQRGYADRSKLDSGKELSAIRGEARFNSLASHYLPQQKAQHQSDYRSNK